MIEISRIPTSPILLRAVTTTTTAALPFMTNNISLSKTDVGMLTSTTCSPARVRTVLPPPTVSSSSVVVVNDEPTSTTRTRRTNKKQVRFASRLVQDESPSTASPLHRLDQDEPWQSLWYSYDELTSIKNEVHQTSHRLKRFIILTAAANNANNNNNAAAASSSSSSSAAAIATQQQQQHHHPRRSQHHETTAAAGLNHNKAKAAAGSMAAMAACCTTPSLAVSDATRGLESRSCPERQRRKYLTIRYVLHVARSLQQQQQPVAPSADTVVASRARICSQWATQLAFAEAQCDYWRAYHDDDDDEENENYYQPASPNKRRLDDGETKKEEDNTASAADHHYSLSSSGTKRRRQC
jgi:hypothetical protein